MDKKTFSRFVNHLEGFTQRIIEQKTCPPPKQGFEIFVFLYLILCLNILVKDLDLALFFILDIKTELSTQNYQHRKYVFFLF